MEEAAEKDVDSRGHVTVRLCYRSVNDTADLYVDQGKIFARLLHPLEPQIQKFLATKIAQKSPVTWWNDAV